MGMRMMMGVFGIGVLLTMSSVPSAWAADGDATAEAASVEPIAVDTPAIEHADTTDTTREQILQEIEAVRHTDPELAAEMEHQLELLESGELDLTEGTRDAALTAPTTGGTTLNVPTLQGAGRLPRTEMIGPPVGGTGGMPDYMTPELREQLFNVFDGVGRGELTEEQARGQAEAIMREHGIDPREMGQGHEGAWEDRGEWDRPVVGEPGEPFEGVERAWEQMSPEAREQMERFFEGSEHEMSGREFEGATREFEAATREYEAATREYEAPTHEYEAPQHEYEAPQHEYEAPQHEYEMPEGGTPQPY